jgi:hypothetical protein
MMLDAELTRRWGGARTRQRQLAADSSRQSILVLGQSSSGYNIGSYRRRHGDGRDPDQQQGVGSKENRA